MNGIYDNEPGALVFTRRVGEAVLIGPPESQVRVSLVGMRGKKCRLMFVAPRVIPIWREEIAAAATAKPTTDDPLAGTIWASGCKGGAA